MLDHAGTGVSTYARILERVQAELSDTSCVLEATPSRLAPVIGALGRRTRQTKQGTRSRGDGCSFTSPDVFRRAHIHFGIFGRLLRVTPAYPFGIMHWTYPVPLYMEGWINIYAVHDVIPITQPSLSAVSAYRLDKTLRAIARVADGISTISDASLREIASLGIFANDRITNSGLACEDFPRSDPAVLATFRQMGLVPKQYFLFSGSVEERKNVPRMLAAYRQANLSIPLVIVGPETHNGQDIEKAIRLTPGAIRLPYQTQESLHALVENARALIFVSLAEGFGLPVIEAMTKGTAVLSSKIPAVKEVAGDAALLVDPEDTQEMVQAMLKLANDQSIVDKFVARGHARARLHSIARFSERVAAIYQSVLLAKPGASQVSERK